MRSSQPMRPTPSMADFLSLGFRPFYLGAAVFAAVSIPLWIAAFLTGSRLTMAYPDYTWHSHEMLFGFAPAVIAGFLLTAVRNWTGLPTPSGWSLGVLFGVWALGRILPFLVGMDATALVDLAFLPLLAVVLAIPLWRARNRRNGFVIGVLLVLWLCNALFYASHLQLVPPVTLRTAITIAMDAVLLLMTVIAGRIIPNFSASAIPGLKPITSTWIDGLAIGGVLLIGVTDAAGLDGDVLPGGLFPVLLYGVAVVHLVRLAGWKPWRTAGNVLLLVLPLSYLWIPLHLALRGWHGTLPGQMEPVSAHALLVGAMAGLMLAMMTRSALGHTGRPLRAGAAEITCFAAIHLAALIRTFGPSLVPGQYPAVLTLSAVLWTLAFATFAVSYAARLTTPRADTVATGSSPPGPGPITPDRRPPS